MSKNNTNSNDKVQKPPNKRVRPTTSSSTQSDESILIDMEDSATFVKNNMVTKEDLKIFATEIKESLINEVKKEVRIELLHVMSKMNDLTEKIESIVHENEILAKDNQSLREEQGNTEIKIANLERRVLECERVGNYNEQYSRKHNVKILGMTEDRGEILREKLCATFRNICNVDILSDDILATHRLPSKYTNMPAPIICKFKNADIKSNVMRQKRYLFNNHLKIFDDITKKNSELINRLKKDERIESAWYFNGSVYGKAHGRIKCKIDIKENFDKILQARFDSAVR